MSSRKALQLQLDSGHCRAICDEIGEQLRSFSTERPMKSRSGCEC